MNVKAYIVTEEFEGSCVVVFAERAVVARRDGANELDAEFGEVSCRRAPWADEYAPGPVPIEAEISKGGFWYECGCGCGRRIDSDQGSASDADENPMSPVFVDRLVFWNQACKDADDKYHREAEEKKKRDQADAEAAVIAKFPFATGIMAYRRYSGKEDALWASFNFPGGVRHANWQIGGSSIAIAGEDLAAWGDLTKQGEP